MSYGRIELPLGLALTGIGIALLLPAINELQKHGPGGGLVTAGVLGVLGTSLGMSPAWVGDSLRDYRGWIFHGTWILAGLVFSGVFLFGAFLSNGIWWRAGLVILALVQLIAIGAPIVAGLRAIRAEKNNVQKP